MEKAESYDNLTADNYSPDSGKISVAESVIVVLISLTGYFANLIGALSVSITGGVAATIGWIPVVGWVGGAAATGAGITAYFFCKAISLSIWALLSLWASFRSAKGGMTVGKKLLSLGAGKVGDEVTLGLFPMETVALIFTIFYNNRSKKD